MRITASCFFMCNRPRGAGNLLRFIFMSNVKSDYKNLPSFLSQSKIEEKEFENEYNNWVVENPDLPFNDFMWKFFEKQQYELQKNHKQNMSFTTN